MSRTHILNISVRVLDGMNTVVDLDGAIDLSNSHGLRTKLFERLAATPRLVLNMSGIRYVDSAGIATLVEVLKEARVLQKDFVLFGVGTTVRDVLRLTNMVRVFQIFDTEEHALAGQ